MSKPKSKAEIVAVPATSRGRFIKDLPETNDPKLIALLAAIRERGELYDDSVLTPAFEARNVNRPGVHATKKGTMSRFTANGDFPWRVPAGVDESPNASRWFARIKPESGGPVVVRQERPFGSVGDRNEYWQWYFPVGTTFAEIARVHDVGGNPYTFQTNQLTLDGAGWDPEIYRSELIASLGALESASGDVVRADVSDPYHPRRPAYDDAGVLFGLPAMPADKLAGTRFVPVSGKRWGEIDGVVIAGPTAEDFSLVPKHFMGCLIEVSRASCVRCHQDAGQHVDKFDKFGSQRRNDSGTVGSRHWYGRVRGNDGILSWHPFTEDSIATDGSNKKVRLRKGDIEIFDPKRHNIADYPGMLK